MLVFHLNVLLKCLSRNLKESVVFGFTRDVNGGLRGGAVCKLYY